MAELFARLEPYIVAMAACSGSHALVGAETGRFRPCAATDFTLVCQTISEGEQE